jgi:hypothetical protein
LHSLSSELKEEMPAARRQRDRYQGWGRSHLWESAFGENATEESLLALPLSPATSWALLKYGESVGGGER